MKLIFVGLAIFLTNPSFAEQSKNYYLLENGLDMNLPNPFVTLRNKKTGCKLLVRANSEKGVATLTAIHEVCADGLARPVKGRAVLSYGSRGIVEGGTDVPMAISY